MELDTRTKILETATILFAQKGFAGVSIREVIMNANVSLSAVSYHFNGKEGLYKAVISYQMELMKEALQKAKSKSETKPLDRLQNYAVLVEETHKKRPLLGKFLNIELGTPTPAAGEVILDYMKDVHGILRKTLREGAALGTFRSDINVEHATIALVGILNFYFLTKSFFEQESDLSASETTSYLTSAFNIYLHGMKT